MLEYMRASLCTAMLKLLGFATITYLSLLTQLSEVNLEDFPMTFEVLPQFDGKAHATIDEGSTEVPTGSHEKSLGTYGKWLRPSLIKKKKKSLKKRFDRIWFSTVATAQRSGVRGPGSGN